MQKFYTEVLNRLETAIHELEIEPIAFYSRQKPLFYYYAKPVRNKRICATNRVQRRIRRNPFFQTPEPTIAKLIFR
ncbi:hypothetical protein [Sphingobacterium chuzhouense]|uniref:hypothetical protein n=1 Tax=Sphingobacterium chuzhouense TaxID=1742264 RepID=UPI0036D2ED1A